MISLHSLQLTQNSKSDSSGSTVTMAQIAPKISKNSISGVKNKREKL
jgi:hypothetical protein